MHIRKGVLLWYFFLIFQGANEAVRMAVTMEGCARLNTTLKDSTLVNNPLECLQRCNTTTVGLRNKTCACVNGVIPTSGSKCNQTCTWKEMGIQYSCGGEDFSIYTIDTDIEISFTAQGVNSGCVRHSQPGRLIVENCSKALHCQCYHVFNPEWQPSTLVEERWEDCLQFCAKAHMHGIFAYNQGNKDCFYKNRLCRDDYWINSYIYDDCSPNKCLNNGTCINTKSSFTCQCQPGFLGRKCEKDVFGPYPCEHNGSCFFNASSAACICSSVYSGEYCRQCTSTTLALLDSPDHHSSAATVGTFSKGSSDLSLQITPIMATSSTSALVRTAYETSPGFTKGSATTKIMLQSSMLSQPTEANPIHLTSSVPSSLVIVVPTSSGKIYLTSTILASSSEPSSRMPAPASTLRTITSTIYPLASTARTRNNSMNLPGPFLTSTPAVTFVLSAVTSNPNDAISGWFSDHSIIIFPICGAVVVLLVVTIIIVCAKMQKMKRRNDELENENIDTPSNSEFDYGSSYSSIQRPDNVYSSYPIGQYKEVPRMGPSQQMHLPRVKIRPDSSFPRYRRDYEDHAFHGRPI